ncbi:MAG: tetratricopeptide repeat protein [Nitrospira sp.]|nr:tetratricopeptide repeat protein [Nitrospira sp.]
MRRSVPVTILAASLALLFRTGPSYSQIPDEPTAPPFVDNSRLVDSPPLVESPPPVESVPLLPAPPHAEPLTREPPMDEQEEDAALALSDLRNAARLAPQNAENRLNLARGLYRIGDLDAAIEECRAAIKLNASDPQAHLQLGVLLMAKQDWRGASAALKEAVQLDSTLAHAHYSLGSVQYTGGNVKAAIESYRQALELQPNFPDARYRLALLLKLINRGEEAAQFMEEAAIGGVPQAQFFLGNAYKGGQGVQKNLALAIYWWARAEEFGHQAAAEALSKTRRLALSADQPERKRKETLDAFQAYRERLREEFPDQVQQIQMEDGETLGMTLLKQNRTDAAVPVLLKEAYALSEAAQAALAKLYEMGWDQQLPPYDPALLACFETTAADGFAPAKKTVARIYGKGLGTAPDLRKAKAALKGLPKQEVKALLDEFATP